MQLTLRRKDEAGMVSGVSAKHWADLDLYFAAAARHGIYVMATLLSFDHFKDVGRPDALRCRMSCVASSPRHSAWRRMLLSDAAVDSFVAFYVVPFVERYKGNPYLWSIDLMNEPDWVHEEEACGRMAWGDISRYFARAAAAIHECSDVPVTVGMSFPKYHSDLHEGDKVGDAFLQGIYPHPKAYIDFYSPHYYDWVGEHYGAPYLVKPHSGWGLTPGKPALLGECPANGSAGYTLTQDYIHAFENGWLGVMPWTSNRVDACGGFEELQPAINHMCDTHKAWVWPLTTHA